MSETFAAIPGTNLDVLRRQSRRAAIVTLCGALAIIVAFGISFYRLMTVEDRIRQLNQQIEGKTQEVDQLTREQEAKRRAADQAREEAKRMRQELDAVLLGRRQVTRAYQLLEGKRFEEAVKLCDELLNQNSNNAQVLAMKAMSLYRQKKYSEAESAGRQALQVDPENSLALHTLLLTLFETQRPEEAAGLFERLLNQNPSNHSWMKTDAAYARLTRSSRFDHVISRHVQKLMEVQSGLQRLGIYHDRIDGKIGPKSLAAIEQICQEANVDPHQVTVDTLLQIIQRKQRMGAGATEPAHLGQ